MKRNLSFVFAILVLATLQAIIELPEVKSHSAPPLQSREFKKTVDISSGAEFRLETDKGSVRLTSWDNNQIDIYAHIEPPKNESEEYGRRAVEGARIDVVGGGSSLTVRSNFDGVPYKDGPLSSMNHSKALPDIHYEIRAPRNLNLTVDIDRSKLDLQAFQGKIRIKSDRSPVTASDLDGEVRINIDRGSLTLNQLKGSLELDADRTDSRVETLSLSGDSRIALDRGELNLRLPASQGLNVNADFSRRTQFSTDFAIAMKSPDRTKFEGTINGGGPRLRLEADRGTINLKSR